MTEDPVVLHVPTSTGARGADEMAISSTHSREVPIFLPGVAPTGRALRLPLVAIVGFRDGKVVSEYRADNELPARPDRPT